MEMLVLMSCSGEKQAWKTSVLVIKAHVAESDLLARPGGSSSRL